MNSRAIIDNLVKLLKEQDIEYQLKEDGEPSLVVVPNALGPYENGTVFLEIDGIAPPDESGLIFQFFTSIAKNLDAEKYGVILQRLNEFNLRTLLGNYGILPQDGILYHKYMLLIPEGTEHPEQTLAETIGLVLNEIHVDFRDLFMALD